MLCLAKVLIFASLFLCLAADCDSCKGGLRTCTAPIPTLKVDCSRYLVFEDPSEHLSAQLCAVGAEEIEFDGYQCRVNCRKDFKCRRQQPIGPKVDPVAPRPANVTKISISPTKIPSVANWTTIEPSGSQNISELSRFGLHTAAGQQLIGSLSAVGGVLLIIITAGLFGVKKIRLRIGRCCMNMQFRRRSQRLNFSDLSSDIVMSVLNENYAASSPTSSAVSRSTRRSTSTPAKRVPIPQLPVSSFGVDSNIDWDDVQLGAEGQSDPIVVSPNSPRCHLTTSTFTGAKSDADSSWDSPVSKGQSGQGRSGGTQLDPKRIEDGSRGEGGGLERLLYRLQGSAAADRSATVVTVAECHQPPKGTAEDPDETLKVGQPNDQSTPSGTEFPRSEARRQLTFESDSNSTGTFSTPTGVSEDVVLSRGSIGGQPGSNSALRGAGGMFEADKTAVGVLQREEGSEKTQSPSDVSLSPLQTDKSQSKSSQSGVVGGKTIPTGRLGVAKLPIGRKLPSWMEAVQSGPFEPKADVFAAAKTRLRAVGSQVESPSDQIPVETVAERVKKAGRRGKS